MEFGVSQAHVLAVLARLHDVVPARRAALKARVQHFQRLGFPADINTGKGRAARYGARQIVELVLAFELLQVGLSPEVVAKALKALGHRLPEALARLTFDPTRERWFDIAVTFDARSLADLAREYGEESRAIELNLTTLDQLPELVEAIGMDRRRLAVINLSAALGIAEQTLREGGDVRLDLCKVIRSWAENVGLRDYLDLSPAKETNGGNGT